MYCFVGKCSIQLSYGRTTAVVGELWRLKCLAYTTLQTHLDLQPFCNDDAGLSIHVSRPVTPYGPLTPRVWCSSG